MKQKAVTKLRIASVLMTIYFVVFFIMNFNYIESLNDFFSILTNDANGLANPVNAGRAQMNKEFIMTEIILGVIGVVVVGFEIYCVTGLIRIYKDLAFRDPLTNVLSRASLNEEFDKMDYSNHDSGDSRPDWHWGSTINSRTETSRVSGLVSRARGQDGT